MVPFGVCSHLQATVGAPLVLWVCYIQSPLWTARARLWTLGSLRACYTNLLHKLATRNVPMLCCGLARARERGAHERNLRRRLWARAPPYWYHTPRTGTPTRTVIGCERTGTVPYWNAHPRTGTPPPYWYGGGPGGLNLKRYVCDVVRCSSLVAVNLLFANTSGP